MTQLRKDNLLNAAVAYAVHRQNDFRHFLEDFSPLRNSDIDRILSDLVEYYDNLNN